MTPDEDAPKVTPSTTTADPDTDASAPSPGPDASGKRSFRDGVRGAASWVRDRVRFRKDPAPEPPPASSSAAAAEPQRAESDDHATVSWLRSLFSRSADQSSVGEQTESADGPPDEAPSDAGPVPEEATRSRLVAAIVSGIRMVSAERDRDEIIRWFVTARDILSRDASKKDIAKALYETVDTKRFAQLLGNSVLTSLRNYKAANLPLSLKVALPVGVVGAAFLGLQGVGIGAFGGAIGLPVVLLLFLGTAGTTAIVEAFVKDRSVRDPLTKLMLTLVAFETARRVRKELLEAARTDAVVPQRAQVPPDQVALLEHLRSMDPFDFERHVMSFFERDGHPVGVTPRTNDFGLDGYVLHPDGLIIVQCKRYAADNPVGRPEIQQFKGVIEEQKALRGYFVTTSRFTKEAEESAALSDRLVLVNAEELLKWHQSSPDGTDSASA